MKKKIRIDKIDDIISMVLDKILITFCVLFALMVFLVIYAMNK